MNTLFSMLVAFADFVIVATATIAVYGGFSPAVAVWAVVPLVAAALLHVVHAAVNCPEEEPFWCEEEPKDLTKEEAYEESSEDDYDYSSDYPDPEEVMERMSEHAELLAEIRQRAAAESGVDDDELELLLTPEQLAEYEERQRDESIPGYSAWEVWGMEDYLNADKLEGEEWERREKEAEALLAEREEAENSEQEAEEEYWNWYWSLSQEARDEIEYLESGGR